MNGSNGSEEGFAVVDDRPMGRTFVVGGRWSDAALSAFAESGTDSLELNYALGYREPNVEFLEQLGDLPVRRLLILDRSLRDLAPLSSLTKLEQIQIDSAPGSVLDLAALPRLRRLACDWAQVRDSVVDAPPIEDLYLHAYDGENLLPLSHLRRLRRLELVEAKELRTLKGVGELSLLERLQIAYARELVDLSAISTAAETLVELFLQNCTGVSTLAGIEALTRLRVLGVSECGAIDSLRPVAALRALEELHAWGSTRILDSDLSPLAQLPELHEVRMKDRRDYRPRVRELPLAAAA